VRHVPTIESRARFLRTHLEFQRFIWEDLLEPEWVEQLQEIIAFIEAKEETHV
jgi:hypothetical protein